MLATSTLRHILNYDRATGVFTWRVSYHAKVQVGRVAGGLSKGYLLIKINGRNYKAHRLAWQYVHSVIPTGVIDHINRNRSDNRIENLRDVGHFENMQNTSRPVFHTSNYNDPLELYQAFCRAARNRFGDKAIIAPPP